MRQCPKCAKRFLESNARICDVDGAVLDLIVVASERDRLVGTTILGRYAIDGVLGDGGMGVVYRARETTTGAPYAVKVLRAEYSDEDDLVVRFEQEARAAAAINNPHIVEIYDWGSLPDASRFFVMEFLEGRSLGDVMSDMPRLPGTDRRRSLGEEFTAHIAMQICEGLGAAHAIGVVHRDIKPDNFHLVRRGDDPYFVKILDFGIAKVQNSKAARTRTGSVFGTPHYMSPEQASGDRNMDHATDIYGLGVLMYEMLAGRVPFDAENLMGILTAHLYHQPTPLRVLPGCEDLAPALEAIVLKCLAKTREARYPSMRALYDDLARVRAGAGSSALEDQDSFTAPFDRSLLDGLDHDGATRPELPVPPEFRASVPPAVAPTLLERDAHTSPAIPAALINPRASTPGAGASGRFGAFEQNPIRFVAQPSVPGVVVDAPDPRALASKRLRRKILLAFGVVATGVSLGVASFALFAEAPPPRTVAVPLPVAAAPSPPAPLPTPAAPPPSPSPAAPLPSPLPLSPPPRPAPSATVILRTLDGSPASVSRRQGARWLPMGTLPMVVVRPRAGQEVYRVESVGTTPTEVPIDAHSPAEIAVTLRRMVRSHRRDRGERAPTTTPLTGVTSPSGTPSSQRGGDGLHDPF